MLNKWYIDFETRSVIDLKKTGTDVYSKDSSTDALCLAYAKNDEAPQLWKLGDPSPHSLLSAVRKGERIYAHNASFEYQIWNNVCVPKYGWPYLYLKQTFCTMAQAYNMALPGSLDHASKSVGISIHKDMAGHRVMMQLAQPRGYNPDGSPIWWDPSSAKDETDRKKIEEKFRQLYNYCLTDIVVERELDKRTLPLSAKERQVWLMDQRINLRGVAIDQKGVEAAIKLAQFEKSYLNDTMKKLTKGQVATCQSVAQLKTFIEDFGISVPSLAKQEVSDLLEQKDLPEACRDALLLRKLAAKSSTSKLDSMINGVSCDGRLRGMFQYYGAYATGRWAGRRVQLHNLTKGKMKPEEVEFAISLMREIQ